MPELSEDILLKASDGDLEAFDQIYQSTSRFVYNVALRMIRNQEDAEEITQDVFLVVYRKLKEFRFESSFKTWVYRIAVNSALNYVKKNSKTRHDVVYDEQIHDVSDGEGIKIVELENKEQVDWFLEKLNSEQRVCVILRSFEGLSYQQIAETLKININTVRSRLKRAREQMLMIKRKKDD